MHHLRKSLPTFFILINLLAMFRVHVPLQHEFFSRVYRPVDAYLSYFSLYQDWMMFAPNPTRLNASLEAEVFFQDGSKATYQFPGAGMESLGEKYLYGEKFRKIITEGIRRDSHQFLWKDAAKFALRNLEFHHINKVPMKIKLIRAWDEIPAISEHFRESNSHISSVQKYSFYQLEVF